MADEGVAINPIHAPLRNLRAASLLRLNRPEEAAEACRNAIALAPSHTEARLLLVRAFRAQERFADALMMIAEGFHSDPGGHYRNALIAEQTALLDTLAWRKLQRDQALENRFVGESTG